MATAASYEELEALSDRLLRPEGHLDELMARGEEHARAVARALVPWGGEVPDRIVWRVLPRAQRPRQRALRTEPHVSHALLCAANGAQNLGPPLREPLRGIAERLSMRRGRSAAARLFEQDVSGAEAWGRAAAAGVAVRPWPMPEIRDFVAGRTVVLTVPRATYGRRFADLPDPFEPLLAIWRLGLVLDRITPVAIELVAPQIAASTS